MLLGNKIDLEPEVDEFAAKSFARTHSFEHNHMISCKTNEGVKDAFDVLAKELQQASKNSTPAEQGLRVTNDPSTAKQSGGCAC